MVKNGVEALRAYTMDPPDLMILDIWMPEMDGMDTLRRVRELAPTAQVMMMSGHGSIETAVKAIKLGAYDYIEKPLVSGKCHATRQTCLGPIPVWNKRTGPFGPRSSESSSWWDNLPPCNCCVS